MIIRNSHELNVTNVQSLPTGLRCNFLVCIIGHNGTLIAKQWKRTAPKIQTGEAVICFTNEAMKQAQKLNN